MKLTIPIERTDLDTKTEKKYAYLVSLIDALNQKELTESFVNTTNDQIEELNKVENSDSSLKKKIGKVHLSISGRMTKELKYVTKNYYRTLWMSLGMTAIGLPFGVMFSVALDSFAFLGLGLPIGIAIGIALGSSMDQKAEKEGRQLDVVNSY